MSSSEHILRYVCGPVAKRFHTDKESRVKLLIGPFGTGKTSSAAYDQIMLQSKRVLPQRGVRRSRFAVVRNTYPMLRDTTVKSVLEWFPPGVFGEYNSTEKRYLVRIEDREIEILFRALDIEKDVRNLLSLEITGAWCDEAREIKSDIFKGLLGRVGRFPSLKDFEGKNPFLAPSQVLLTTNYPSREHWLYKDFVETPVEGYAIYEQTQNENKHNLVPGYYENLEKDYANRPDLLKTLVRGEWGVTVKGKQVYPNFNHRLHVADAPLLPVVCQGAKAGRTVVRGWDNTGLSPACVLTYVNTLGQWFIFKEFCEEDIDIVDFGEMVKLWCGENLPSGTRYRDIGDPAGRIRDSRKKSPAMYLAQECDIHIEDGIQTFKIRRESVASRLTKLVCGEPALVVDPGCTRLIDGFDGGYSYPEIGNTGCYHPDPAKNEYSHIHDALQYPATILFEAGSGQDHEEYHEPQREAGRSSTGGY